MNQPKDSNNNSSGSLTRVAMLTGASGGIGSAVAWQLAQERQVTVLVLLCRDTSQLVGLVDKLKEDFPELSVQTMAVDVGQAKEVEGAVQQIFKDFHRLDILINAAGLLMEAPLMMTRADSLMETLSTNTLGSFYAAQYASRLMMRGGGGVIIHLGSVVGIQGAAGQAAYSASKSALEGLTRSLARELAAHNIRVNLVAPGFIETAMVEHYGEEQRAELRDKTALGRLGSAEDVAKLVSFLCSSGASYITGQTIRVDGLLQL